MINDNISVARIMELEEIVRRLEEKIQVLEEWKESVEGRKLLEVESAEGERLLEVLESVGYEDPKADMEFYKIVAPRLYWITEMKHYMWSDEFRGQFLPRGSLKLDRYKHAMSDDAVWNGFPVDFYKLNPKDDGFEIKFIAEYKVNKEFRNAFGRLKYNLPNWFYLTPIDKLSKELVFDDLIVGCIEPHWKKFKKYDEVCSKLRDFFISR